MSRIPPEIIDQILAATDIVEVIGGYFQLKRAGATYKALCPFHQEKSPSFTVNPQRQIFKCFGCGAGGTALRFVMDYEHLDFGAAARKLAERAGIKIVEAELSPEDSARLGMRRRLLGLHADAAEWFHHQLLKSRGAQVARDYLKGRGVNIDIAKGWKLGYAPDSWDSFSLWARGQGYTIKEITQSGLVSLRDGEEESSQQDPDDYSPHYYDRFRNRVMFPICNDTGEVIAFSGRVLQSDAKAAKYVNSPETMLFTKGSVLFGIHRSKRALIDKKSAIVCEGQLDLITAFESGVQNVIAPQGTAFTDRQAHILKRYVDEVILCFDADLAGEKAAERSLTSLLGENLSVRVVEMPQGEDPDSLIRSQGAAAFLGRVTSAKDFFDFQIDRMANRPDFDNPRARTQAARKLAGWIGLLKDPILRDMTVTKVANRMEVATPEIAKLVRPGTAPATKEDEALASSKKPAPLDVTIRLMMLTILHDAEARAWLQDAPWRELFAREPEVHLLPKILEAKLPENDQVAINHFLSTLDSAEEALASTLLQEKPLPNPLTNVQDCWNKIARRQLQARIESLQSRVNALASNPEDQISLIKEIDETRNRLQAIPTSATPKFD